MLQYADDTSLFLRNKESLGMVLKELHEFEKVAGPSVNKNKTIMKWLGSKQNQWNISDFELQWDEKCVKYLGVYIFKDEKIVATLNWENK